VLVTAAGFSAAEGLFDWAGDLTSFFAAPTYKNDLRLRCYRYRTYQYVTFNKKQKKRVHGRFEKNSFLTTNAIFFNYESPNESKRKE
jgi:hypothetical protein